MSKTLSTLALMLAVVPFAAGHSWIEQMRNVDAKGNYVGQYGYPRGYVAKTDPGYNGDSMNFNLPAAQNKAFIDNTTPLCKPSQTKQTQSSDKYPRLKTPAGGFIALRYAENGHVTEPFGRTPGKPDLGGTVFVYGTTEPKSDETLATVINWTKDGKGGNGGGKLLTMNNFDDGRCYEINNTPNSKQRQKKFPSYAFGQAVEGAPSSFPQFCETNVQIPETAETGKPYTLYWVWQWNTKPGVDPGLPVGKDEWYTTCMDVDVIANGTVTKEASPKFALGQQDAQSVAVSDFAARTAKMTDIVKGEFGPIFSAKPTGGSAPSKPTAAPSASFTTVPFPSNNGTASSSTALEVPTLSGRPGHAPTGSPSGDIVTVTDTAMVTVTAPVTVTVTATPASQPAVSAHSIYNRNGAKFRGMFAA
ncbi:hypothetical protein GMOD_00008206 [Pyrenophora seminiperda CCB06]|uniref:DUF7492 domain-containing protein n=1 Tax=Pyrenophora seminiperda CCB06 TaxID=1302712 RepID=A0A3M7M261_9PLEO|nr:hypothetical protein GMOD_00008206 [Pyrenophora seminiperda CCB06]